MITFVLRKLGKKKLFFLFLCIGYFQLQAFSQSKPVDVVFCMDLSGSTNGLIDDLRDRIWEIIIQFQAVKPMPVLRIGMVAYSRPSYGKANGYAKIISPLTNDFDQLSYDLFAIRPYIEKGDQLVGAALQLAVKGINWNKENDAIKMIFLIGNGSVGLGGVDFRAICDEAILKNISIHPVFCSKANKSKEITGWLEIARVNQTELSEIIINKRSSIEPVSKDIPALRDANERLSKTYVYYGDHGFNYFKLFKGADVNAMQGGVLSYEGRVFYKMKYLTDQSKWDLVDFVKKEGVLPVFDHNSLADTLKMVPDDNLYRAVISAKEKRSQLLKELNNLLPNEWDKIIGKQRVDKNGEKIETLENMVLHAYYKTLSNNGFVSDY